MEAGYRIDNDLYVLFEMALQLTVHTGILVAIMYFTAMPKHKKQQTTEEIYTAVVPVVFCADEAQVNQIMQLCGIPRALTYNKLGSLKGWGLDWKKADPSVRKLLKPCDIGLPAKLWEWSVNDTQRRRLTLNKRRMTDGKCFK